MQSPVTSPPAHRAPERALSQFQPLPALWDWSDPIRHVAFPRAKPRGTLTSKPDRSKSLARAYSGDLVHQRGALFASHTHRVRRPRPLRCALTGDREADTRQLRVLWNWTECGFAAGHGPVGGWTEEVDHAVLVRDENLSLGQLVGGQPAELKSKRLRVIDSERYGC